MLRLKMFAAFTGISSNIFQRKQFCILNSVLNLLIIASLSKMLPMLHKGLKALLAIRLFSKLRTMPSIFYSENSYSDS